LAWRSDSQARTLLPNLTVVTFKMWAYSPKIAEICNFRYKFAQKRYIPLSDFYNIWLGGGSPRSAPSYQISLFWLKNVGLQPLKSRKNRNVWYKFTPMGTFLGSAENVEYRCSTTNLPLCNDTIIVLKITVLRSVSVITNFIIPKRE